MSDHTLPVGHILHMIHFKADNGMLPHHFYLQPLTRMTVNILPVVGIADRHYVNLFTVRTSDTANYFFAEQLFYFRHG